MSLRNVQSSCKTHNALGYGPFTVAAGRIGIGALALLAIVAVTRSADLAINDPKAVCIILLLGILNFALPFSLLAWGIQRAISRLIVEGARRN